MPKFNEPIIIIDGVRLSPGEAMTVRVAVISFAEEMAPGCLGDDDHGKKMQEGYLGCAHSVLDIMHPSKVDDKDTAKRETQEGL